MATADLVTVDVQIADVREDVREAAQEDDIKSLPLELLPPRLAQALQRFDKNQDGTLDRREIEEISNVLQCLDAGKIPFSALPARIQEIIAKTQGVMHETEGEGMVDVRFCKCR